MSPRMAQLHADLINRVDASGCAVLLDTPYGFQENADELSQRAVAYFRDRVRQSIEIASFRDRESLPPIAREHFHNQLRDARYVFAGPGSPSYALRQWRGSDVPDLLGRRLAEGGCVTVASAAAICLGRFALPVYEIYKVGESPHWVQGLDLLGPLGLDAIVPHYDNSEGGTHDTRYCYMGFRRFGQLEEQLPAGTTILGVAEQTAAIFDLEARTLEVRGRGFTVLRRDGTEYRFHRGQSIRLDEVLSSFPTTSPASADQSMPVVAVAENPKHGGDPEREADESRRRFVDAIDRLDASAAIVTLLDLDERLAGSSLNGMDRDALRRARSVYRGMLARLGEALQAATTPAREPIAPLVELALRLRDEARRDRRYPEADLVRDALHELGIEVRDTPVGTQWSPAGNGERAY